MFVCRDFHAAHCEKQSISVEFAVIHYTAQSLKRTLDIFLNPESRPLSCHLLIDEKGQLYELVRCWDGVCHKAFHAGKSRFTDSRGKQWESFNKISLGIEIVNWNGNLFPFGESQYNTLFFVLDHLKKIYPALQNPDRILGHEHIAGFRGKKDPGYLFDWEKLFKELYCDQNRKETEWHSWLARRKPVLTKKQHHSLLFLSEIKNWNDQKAKQISLILEKLWPFWFKKMILKCLKLFWTVFYTKPV